MITKSEYNFAKNRVLKLLKEAGIIITKEEERKIEITDLGLNDFEQIGLTIIVYVNTERYCAKELILLPKQTCPEHRHPSIKSRPGKQETFHCRWGEVYLYVPGKKVTCPRATIANKYQRHFTVWKEVILKPGEQYTIEPDTLHWFQAGEKGAIISEFSSRSYDEFDMFTDPNIQRVEK